ncbi:MAG: DNA-3-methyladenine glycosylase family protein [Solirubrobacteraceae bacterium]
MELRLEVTPAAPFRLPRRGGMDGVLRCRGGVLERLLHREGEPVHVRVTQTSRDRVLFGARSRSDSAARYGIERMRFALGVDDDLRDFHRRFADDPLIGSSVRRRPWVRVMRRPEPFEALAWAICEQLIEYERAAAIQRRVVWAFGARCPEGSGLRDVPTAAVLSGVAPAKLQSFDLAGARACTLVRTAREVGLGRVDLHGSDQACAWRRLRAMRGIGPWTVEMLALRGQGRHDQLPAGDVGLLKFVGR